MMCFEHDTMIIVISRSPIMLPQRNSRFDIWARTGNLKKKAEFSNISEVVRILRLTKLLVRNGKCKLSARAGIMNSGYFLLPGPLLLELLTLARFPLLSFSVRRP